VLLFVSRDLEHGGVPAVSPSTKKFFFSDFNEIWYVDRGRRLMHDGMPYDPIPGQGEGLGASELPKIALFKVENLHSIHDSRGVDRQSRTRVIFV